MEFIGSFTFCAFYVDTIEQGTKNVNYFYNIVNS